jgi:predicted AlkP superfamily phosphohydrolase/phosphomutase
MLGAVIVASVFLLADFTRAPRDLLTLTFYAIVPLACLGAMTMGLVTVVAVVVARIRRRPPSPERFTTTLATLAFGGVMLAVASSAYVVARRPTIVASLSTLLPILAGMILLLVATYFAGRTRPSRGVRRLAGRPALAIGLAAASLVVPPVLGLLRPTLVGETPVPPSMLPIERDQSVSKPRVLLLGWDGATWDVIDPLLRKGEMPTLRRLLERGSRGEIVAEPQVIQPFANSASAGARTPALWETVITGKRPLLHGIWDFECKTFAGVEQAVPFRIAGDHGGTTVPTTSDMARAERLWHMLDRAGISTAVVGWPTTWPARRAVKHGIISSPLAREDLPDTMQPNGAVDVRALCSDTDSTTHQVMRHLFALPATDLALPPWKTAETALEADLLKAFFWDYKDDMCNVRVALELEARHRPDFLAVYLSLVDITQHKFWRYYQPELFADVPPEHVARYGHAIEFAYESFDAHLARLLEAMGEGTTVIVLADHGAGPWVFGGLQGFLETALKRSHPEYSGNHRLNGMLVAHGPGIAADRQLEQPKHVDVTPTVLHLFGLPIGEDMPGRVLREMMQGGAVARPTRSIGTYQTGLSHGGTRPTSSRLDAEIEQRLRQLGYVQ